MDSYILYTKSTSIQQNVFHRHIFQSTERIIMEVVAADRADVPTYENDTTAYAGPRKKATQPRNIRKKNAE